MLGPSMFISFPVMSAAAEIPGPYIDLPTCWSRPYGSSSSSRLPSVSSLSLSLCSFLFLSSCLVPLID